MSFDGGLFTFLEVCIRSLAGTAFCGGARRKARKGYNGSTPRFAGALAVAPIPAWAGLNSWWLGAGARAQRRWPVATWVISGHG